MLLEHLFKQLDDEAVGVTEVSCSSSDESISLDNAHVSESVLVTDVSDGKVNDLASISVDITLIADIMIPPCKSISTLEQYGKRNMKRKQIEECAATVPVDENIVNGVSLSLKRMRRNAMVPGGMQAEIARDVGLIFQMDSINFLR